MWGIVGDALSVERGVVLYIYSIYSYLGPADFGDLIVGFYCLGELGPRT